MIGCSPNVLACATIGLVKLGDQKMNSQRLMTLSSAVAVLLGGGDCVLAQPPRQCTVVTGVIPTPIKAVPYDLLITSRVEARGDEQVVITCVQNNTPGYVRLRWLIPDLNTDFEGPDIIEKEWHVPKDTGLNLALGCVIYGNLNYTRKASFFADSAQLIAADSELKNGCPTR